jgi:hypothetical protein
MHFAKSDTIFNKHPQCMIYSIIHLVNQTKIKPRKIQNSVLAKNKFSKFYYGCHKILLMPSNTGGCDGGKQGA